MSKRDVLALLARARDGVQGILLRVGDWDWDDRIEEWCRETWAGSRRLTRRTFDSRNLRLRTSWLLTVLVLAGFIAAGLFEAGTSALQSHAFARMAALLGYSMAPGSSADVVYPKNGPSDRRLGYSRLPEFRDRLEARGYRVTEQSRFSPALAFATKMGISPPFQEPAVAGLVVRGANGEVLYDATHGAHQFRQYSDIPPLAVRAALFIENRQLDGSKAAPNLNPAVEWNRLGKASLLWVAGRIGLPVDREGGSTLAVQLEKYRHSVDGRTTSPVDKARQILSASLRAYRNGPDTREERRRIILEYLNTLPLAAAPGHGEVHGIGNGLWIWFRMDPERTFRQLDGNGTVPAQARAFKHVLALLCATRAPSHYLVEDRAALERRVDAFVGLLREAGMIGESFARQVNETPLRFARTSPAEPSKPFYDTRATGLVRRELMQLLGVTSLYDVDRLHLEVESTIDSGLQADATRLFQQLADSGFVRGHGLLGKYLLGDGDPRGVTYSLLLYERGQGAGALRAEADNLDEPFDPNFGMKLELGSTAKLRTLVQYLEIVSALREERLRSGDAPVAGSRAPDDPVTRWVAETMDQEPGIPLDTLLSRALDRTYSASPYEVFYTGGGDHEFHNFDPDDNGRRPTVRDALVRSTNLVFIRLMRDLVRYYEQRLPYDAEAVLSQAGNPDRQHMLEQIADEEAEAALARAYRKYHGVAPETLPDLVLGKRAQSPRSLAILFFAWNHGTGADSLRTWMAARGVAIDDERAGALARDFDNPRFSIVDYGYLLDQNPLEVWAAGMLAHQPDAEWENLLRWSAVERATVSEWLLDGHHRHAQDLRLRTRIERDAFERMAVSWRRLGFPFGRLVPSYATAIGSSSDKPAALAELMGILLNDGMRLPQRPLTRLRFASGTPYDATFEPTPDAGERLLPSAVARVTRAVLAEVVDRGTAQRIRNTFVDSEHNSLPVGAKTGSGDNRFKTFARGGWVLTSRATSRTATVVFYVGDRYYGVLTATVSGPRAGNYSFTSVLPLAVLKLLAPSIERSLAAPPPSREDLASRPGALATAIKISG